MVTTTAPAKRWLLLALGIITLVKTNGLKCYICGEDSSTELHTGRKMNCDFFDSQNETYRLECPAVYKSCSTYANELTGRVTKRGCEEPDVNDCQTANYVQYCYCSRDLCNLEKHHFGVSNRKEDDEDSDEIGSGQHATSTSPTYVYLTTAETKSSTCKNTESVLSPHTFMLLSIFWCLFKATGSF